MTSEEREELELLRRCTASIDVKMDVDRALRGHSESLERCAEILRRARPSAHQGAR